MQRSSTRSGSATRSRSRACTARRQATCSTASCSCCPTHRARREALSGGAAVRPRRAAERRQVQPVQPPGGGGALGRLRGGRHHPRRRRCGRRVARRPGALRRHRGHAPSDEGPGRRVLQRRARDAGDRAGARRDARDRRGAGFTVEDKKIANVVIDAGRALLLVANKWDLVEEKDDTYADLTDTVRQFADRTRDANLGATRDVACTVSPRSCSTCTPDGPRGSSTSKVNEVIQRAQRERPDPAQRRHAALRDPGRRPARRRSWSSAARTSPTPRTGGTSRTGCGASSISRGCRCACGTDRGSGGRRGSR